jgi:hypothetical protein
MLKVGFTAAVVVVVALLVAALVDPASYPAVPIPVDLTLYGEQAIYFRGMFAPGQ